MIRKIRYFWKSEIRLGITLSVFLILPICFSRLRDFLLTRTAIPASRMTVDSS